MEQQTLRKSMESLWKEAFGDSDAYVKTVFDSYFKPENVAYREKEGELESALLGIPYSFESSSGKSLRGLYLCGLSTVSEARRRGYMSALLEDINARAQERGFDFTFLIPASEGMRHYYADRGYHDAFFKVKEHYVRGHKFGGEVVDLSRYNGSDLESAISFLTVQEHRRKGRDSEFKLLHDTADWKAVLQEALVSNSPVYIGRENGGTAGMAFSEKKDRTIEIKKIYAKSPETEKGLIAAISAAHPQCNIDVVKELDQALKTPANQLWSPFYAQTNAKTAEYEDVAEIEEPYNPALGAWPLGMIRIFDIRKLLRYTCINPSDSGPEKNQNSIEEELKGFSEAELVKIILRRPVGENSDALEKILALPELSFSMSLLLE